MNLDGLHCAVRGCPHRLRGRWFVLTWRCPDHDRDERNAEHLYDRATRRAQRKDGPAWLDLA